MKNTRRVTGLYRISKNGSRCLVTAIPWKNLKYYVFFDLPKPYGQIHKKVFKEICYELMPYLKLRTIDFIRINNVVRAHMLACRAKFLGTEVPNPEIALDVPAKDLLREMQKIVPKYVRIFQEHNTVRVVGGWIDEKVRQNEKKVMRVLLDILDKKILDLPLKKEIISEMKHELSKDKVALDLTSVVKGETDASIFPT